MKLLLFYFFSVSFTAVISGLNKNAHMRKRLTAVFGQSKFEFSRFIAQV